MDRQEILLKIQDTNEEMHRMNVCSPHYKDLKRHIHKLYKELNKIENRR